MFYETSFGCKPPPVLSESCLFFALALFGWGVYIFSSSVRYCYAAVPASGSDYPFVVVSKEWTTFACFGGSWF